MKKILTVFVTSSLLLPCIAKQSFIIEGKIIKNTKIEGISDTIFIQEFDSWFLPQQKTDTIIPNKEGIYIKEITINNFKPIWLRFYNVHYLLFPKDEDTLNINFIQENNLNYTLTHINQRELYSFFDDYSWRYRKNAGFDSLHKAWIKLNINEFIENTDSIFTLRQEEIKSKSKIFNNKVLYSFLRNQLIYEYESKRLDYLMNHFYYSSSGKNLNYYLADSIYYNSFPFYLFNDNTAWLYDYCEFVKMYITDYYFKQYELNPEDMRSVSRSEFKFNYAVNNFTGVTRDVAIVQIIKELIDIAFEKEDFLKAKNLISRYEKCYTEFKYYEYILNYLFDKNKKFISQVDFRLLNTDKQIIKLSDFGDNLKVLFFYGTWCAPCKKEIPYFNEYISNNDNQNISYFYIALENDNFENWKEFVFENKLQGINLYAENGYNNEDLEEFNLSFVPKIVIIDSSDKILFSNAPMPSNSLEHILIEIKAHNKKYR